MVGPSISYEVTYDIDNATEANTILANQRKRIYNFYQKVTQEFQTLERCTPIDFTASDSATEISCEKTVLSQYLGIDKTRHVLTGVNAPATTVAEQVNNIIRHIYLAQILLQRVHYAATSNMETTAGSTADTAVTLPVEPLKYVLVQNDMPKTVAATDHVDDTT